MDGMRVWSREDGERIVGMKFKYVEILWSVGCMEGVWVRRVCEDSRG